MLGKTAMAVLFAALITGLPVLVNAAEPLFDTEALSQLIDKGIEHLQAKKYDAAITEFTDATYIAPNAEAFYYLGYAYYMKGKNRNDPESRKNAMENFTRAYEIDPNFTPTRFRPEEDAGMAPKGPAKQPKAAAQPAPEPAEPQEQQFEEAPEEPATQPDAPSPQQ
ncbi:MAG: hypothetical protein A2X56_11290 [Nitrospirae bacterium GWC2_57_13]|jgi:tetratricopeptide (TPR) repeat protein|nr:MAG: hypothetical protein A2X56_11290 [Nitrospirae bacterium GWC2_57_13]HAS54177.1 hypothetical protein [Nitrospiraceae bacterium]